MSRVLIVAETSEAIEGLRRGLSQRGLPCWIIPDDASTPQRVAERAPDLVLVVVDGLAASPAAEHTGDRSKPFGELPVIVLLSRKALGDPGLVLGAEDFVVEPWDAAEVVLRAKRVLRRVNGTDEDGLIRCGDLAIDVTRYEVKLRGEIVPLTFKEYELLRLLASSRGRVFTRDALLNRVWGYDYYGGDRTVDVHIRRLRGKLGESGESLIETVRNIGYKFRGA